MFNNGDIVKIKESHRSAVEKDVLYRVTNVNNATGRCYIELVDCNFPLSSQEHVSFEMLDLVRAAPMRVTQNNQCVHADAAEVKNKFNLVDFYSIDNQTAVYTVSLDPGYLVDVKVCSDTGLIHVMQNSDGSTVYKEASDEVTVPEYKYDEEEVVSFARNEHLKRVMAIKPALSEQILSTSARTVDIRFSDKIPAKETSPER